MVDGVKGVHRAVLIRTSMGASRRSVKKRQTLSQSLAVRLPERASVPFVDPNEARIIAGFGPDDRAVRGGNREEVV